MSEKERGEEMSEKERGEEMSEKEIAEEKLVNKIGIIGSTGFIIGLILGVGMMLVVSKLFVWLSIMVLYTLLWVFAVRKLVEHGKSNSRKQEERIAKRMNEHYAKYKLYITKGQLRTLMLNWKKDKSILRLLERIENQVIE